MESKGNVTEFEASSAGELELLYQRKCEQLRNEGKRAFGVAMAARQEANRERRRRTEGIRRQMAELELQLETVAAECADRVNEANEEYRMVTEELRNRKVIVHEWFTRERGRLRG